MADKKSVKLIECITTWQGEGCDTGKRMLIVRFKYCNLHCEWCDTKIKMRAQHESTHMLSNLQEAIDTEKCGILITGGEPTLKRHFDDALLLLNELNYSTANVESNGHNLEALIGQTDDSKPVNFMYSPKIFGPKDLDEAVAKSELLQYIPNVYFKIVFEDNHFINKFLELLESKNIHQRVFLMPEGTTREKLFKNAPAVFDACEKYKFNFSSREHLIYDFV